MSKAKDKKFMLRAIQLAAKARGKTFPNPLVGVVLVKNGKIISEGFHEKAGKQHAEIVALKKAGRIARNADLYINLESCSHYGKTPPCVTRIIKAGIRNVFISMQDPNHLVNGKGINILRKNGIKVKVGICKKEAEDLNIIYTEFIKNFRK